MKNGRPSLDLTGAMREIGINPEYGLAPAALEFFNDLAGTGLAIPGFERENLDIRDHFNQHGLYLDQWDPDSCLITMPMEYGAIYLLESSNLAEAALALPSGSVPETVPGTTSDVQLWVGHHEADHCQNLNERFFEYESDMHANEQYAINLADGVAHDPAFPHFMRFVRSGEAVMGNENDITIYDVNGLVPLSGEQGFSEAQLVQAETEIGHARDIMYERIEENTGFSREELLDGDFAIDRAHMAYVEMKRMIEDGTLNDMPYARLNAERFIEGAELYTPEVFGVLEEDAQMRVASTPQPTITTAPLQALEFDNDTSDFSAGQFDPGNMAP